MSILSVSSTQNVMPQNVQSFSSKKIPSIEGIAETMLGLIELLKSLLEEMHENAAQKQLNPSLLLEINKIHKALDKCYIVLEADNIEGLLNAPERDTFKKVKGIYQQINDALKNLNADFGRQNLKEIAESSEQGIQDINVFMIALDAFNLAAQK